MHYENKPIQVYWKFYNQKIENFQIKILIFLLFLLKNIDCGYSLEPPRWNKKNNVYPCKPHFYYVKVGFKGVNII